MTWFLYGRSAGEKVLLASPTSNWWPWYYDASIPGNISIEAAGGGMGSMFAPIGGISLGSVLQDAADIAYASVFGRSSPGTMTAPSVGSISGSSIASRSQLPSRTVYDVPVELPFPTGPSLPGLTIQKTVWGRRPYRHMNPCNPRALKRAIRRVKRFEKFAKQSIRITKRVKAPRKRTCR